MKPIVSVIVPTYNGENKIVKALESLERQTFRDFETIVVVDGSTDRTQTILKNRKFNLPSLKVIYQENKGRSGSRNRGAKEAQADLLLFLDDDMRLEEEGIAKHLAFHQSNKNPLLLMGAALEDVALMKTDIQRYRATLSRKWSTISEKTLKPLTKDNFFLMAANFSIPKKIFDTLEGFDEKLTDAEDYDLGKRAMEQEMPIYFDGTIIGWHDDFITCKSYIKRQQQYQKAHEKLKALYPERYAESQYNYTVPTGIKKLIYRFFAGHFWVNMIDGVNVLRIFPKILRYKIYDIIITANAIHFPLKY